MTYRRVIPRDLFNEANLLKCLGQLWLNLEVWAEDVAQLVEGDLSGGFCVTQSPADGSISVDNVKLLVAGVPRRVFRPLNSRDAYPLYMQAEDEDGEDILIFTDHGSFTDEFLTLLRGFLRKAQTG